MTTVRQMEKTKLDADDEEASRRGGRGGIATYSVGLLLANAQVYMS